MRKILNFTPFLLLLSLPAFGTCPDGKTYPVSLTFDDGPDTRLTPKVLDILKTEKVKGTFFVLGEHFVGGKANPATKTSYDLLDRTKKEGHYIASHTYHHKPHSKMTKAEMKENITKSNPLLKDYLSPILRLPYGDGSFRSNDPVKQAKNDMVMQTIKDSGMKHVGWDIDTNDWDKKKHPYILSSMLKQICSEKGGIVLFHDIQNNTVDHLAEWIKAIRAEGHSIVGLEKFVPEVLNKLPPQACKESAVDKKAEELGSDVDNILKFKGK